MSSDRFELRTRLQPEGAYLVPTHGRAPLPPDIASSGNRTDHGCPGGMLARRQRQRAGGATLRRPPSPLHPFPLPRPRKGNH